MDNRPIYSQAPQRPSNTAQNPYAVSQQNPYVQYASQQFQNWADAQQQTLQNNQTPQIPSGYPQQVAPKVTVIRGRIVTGPEEINPAETPMDGLPSVFPTNDGSYIFMKWWNAQGNLETRRYILDHPQHQIQPQQTQTPVVQQAGPASTPTGYDELQARMGNLEQMIANLANAVTKPTSRAAKKGETAE